MAHYQLDFIGYGTQYFQVSNVEHMLFKSFKELFNMTLGLEQ